MDTVIINITEVAETVTINLSDPDSVPKGGTTGQVLAKASINDYNTVWVTLPDYTAAIALKAPINSPTFTGTPVAPTAAFGTNTTQIATTAFVIANAGSVSAPSGNILFGTGSGYSYSSNLIYTEVSGTGTFKVTSSAGAKVQLSEWIPGYGSIHFHSTPTTGNFALAGNDSITILNSSGGILLQNNNTPIMSVSGGVLVNGPFIMNTNGISIGTGAAPSDSWLHIAPSTNARAQFKLGIGITPDAVSNGHAWFDGADINVVVGGVTKKIAWQ